MVDTTIKITVPPRKRKELLQTFKLILDPIRREEGCVYCNCYVDIEDENCFFISEEWRTREALDNHLRSDQFGVLTGAMGLLDQNPELKICSVISMVSVNVKAVSAPRA